MKRTLSILCVLIGLFSLANAQNPQWAQYTNGDNIRALADEGNDLWVGTSSGLVKLDKTTGIPTCYNICNSGLLDNNVEAIAIDDEGTKWVGGYSHL